MTTDRGCVQVAPDCLVQALQHEAVEQLGLAGGELVLDFSAVVRIDAAAARALEELADRADRVSVKVVLRGANVGIYRALKLLKLTSRFSFVS
jgi:anti-anti-sigma regulatory factor